MGNSPTSAGGGQNEFLEFRKASKSVQYKSSSKGRSSLNKIINNDKNKQVYKGIKIANDPLERDIYVACPACVNKVFDSGLEQDLVCDRCTFIFKSDKAYNKDKIKASLQAQQQQEDQDWEDEPDESSPFERAHSPVELED